MKIKQMIKWNWQNSYMGLIVLYGVFILLYLFAFAVNVSAGGETVNVNGMSTGSVVMMLVYGIVLFSQSLRFGLGNGVSRRTVFLSFLAFFGIFSVCMTVGDVLLQLLAALEGGGELVNDLALLWCQGIGIGWVHSREVKVL